MTARTLIQTSNRDARLRMVARDVDVLLAGGDVVVTVAQHVSRGTLDQGRLAHKLWQWFADFWNQRFPDAQTSAETVKQGIKQQFGAIVTEYNPCTGQREARVKSWAEYSRKERADLITATLAFLAEQGCPDLPEIPASEYSEYRQAQA